MSFKQLLSPSAESFPARQKYRMQEVKKEESIPLPSPLSSHGQEGERERETAQTLSLHRRWAWKQKKWETHFPPRTRSPWSSLSIGGSKMEKRGRGRPGRGREREGGPRMKAKGKKYSPLSFTSLSLSLFLSPPFFPSLRANASLETCAVCPAGWLAVRPLKADYTEALRFSQFYSICRESISFPWKSAYFLTPASLVQRKRAKEFWNW